jgi:hypothetical protein
MNDLMLRVFCVITLLGAWVDRPIYELKAVEMKVELKGGWEEQQYNRVDDAEKGSAGFQYLVELDLSDSTDFVFNELYVERHDYFSEDRLTSWLSDRPGQSRYPSDKLIRRTDLGVKLIAFDHATVFEFEQIRGDGAAMHSKGYIVYGVDGGRAYRIKVAGLKHGFEAAPGAYWKILRSIELF